MVCQLGIISMAKYPLEWHKKNLENFHDSIERLQAEIEQQKTKLNLMVSRALFSHKQMIKAEELGLDEFDPDKFLVKRVKKNDN